MLSQNKSDQSSIAVAVRLLANRGHSIYELTQKLLIRGFTVDQITQCIQYLCEKRYLDDDALCQSAFEKYHDSNNYGAYRIYKMLQARGFSNDCIDKVMVQYDRGKECEKARILMKSKYEHVTTGTYAKIARFLSSRGFSPSTIKKVLQDSKCDD